MVVFVILRVRSIADSKVKMISNRQQNLDKGTHARSKYV